MQSNPLSELLSLIVNTRTHTLKRPITMHLEPSELEEYYNVSDKGLELGFIRPSEIPSVKPHGVTGVDSSSRFIETPYFFLGIGAASAYDRILLKTLDCPNISDWIRGGSGSCKWLALASNVPISKTTLPEYVLSTSPAGEPYDNYNRLIMLSELRLVLENSVLEQILTDGGMGEYIILDGPLYYIPYFIVKSDRRTKYYESWHNVMSARRKLINKLGKEGKKIIGVVKRLEYARFLSKIDPFRIGRGEINDQAYLSILVGEVIKRPEPFIIGPVILDPPSYGFELPRRYAYYVGIPRVHFISRPSNYVFFRFEVLRNREEYRSVVLRDSIGSGSLLPLSNIIVDKRVKSITGFLRNYIVRIMEDAGVTLTYDSMRSIEGFYIG